MANPLAEFQIRRRGGHKKPGKRLQFDDLALVGAGVGADAAAAFPGGRLPDPTGKGGRFLSSAFSMLLHGGLIGGIWLGAWLTPDQEIVEIMEIVSVEDRQELPQRPRAISPASRFKPPVALAPQFHSPAAVQRRAPTVAAPSVLNTVQISQAAPTRIQSLAKPVITSAQAFKPLTPQKSKQLDVKVAKTEVSKTSRVWSPNKALAGPKRIASVSNAKGARALGARSAATGAGALAGAGARRGVFAPEALGKGGPKGDACLSHPSVVKYVSGVKDRVYARWHTGNISGSHQVTLRLQIEASGTAKFVEVVEGTNDTLSLSAAKALRAASPFAPMRGTVRCLAREALLLTFINESAS